MIKNLLKIISYPIRKYHTSSMWEAKLLHVGFHPEDVKDIMKRNREKI
jgi:hypothetical protein